jgi:anti-repressor protein
MSSREIAELTGKRHDHVLRDIEKMLLDISAPNFGVADFEAEYLDGQGKPRKEYLLPKDLTITLVTGYRADLRYKVVKRMEELEEKTVNSGLDALNDPAAMRGILLSYTEKVLQLEEEKKAAQPKVDFYEQYLNADGLYGLQNAGRALNCRPNLFVRWLKANYLFYQGGNLVAKVQFIQNGVFEVKTTLVDDKARPQTYITPKGLKYLEARVPDHIKMKQAS